jgi:hypothetical protein
MNITPKEANQFEEYAFAIAIVASPSPKTKDGIEFSSMISEKLQELTSWIMQEIETTKTNKKQ